jgi:citrate lyase subunit beta-like protein
MWNLGEIAAWKSEYGPMGGILSALLVRNSSYGHLPVILNPNPSLPQKTVLFLLFPSCSWVTFIFQDCADTAIIRTPSRLELLHARSQIVVAAKAFALEAIDMVTILLTSGGYSLTLILQVCVNYKDLDYLKDECEEGRRLGFSGKQAIHPSQVDVIQSSFLPTAEG